MKKLFSILICAFLLSTPSFASSTNSVDDVQQILAKLASIQTIIDTLYLNQDYIAALVENISFEQLEQIHQNIVFITGKLNHDIVPDLEQIKEDVSTMLVDFGWWFFTISDQISLLSEKITFFGYEFTDYFINFVRLLEDLPADTASAMLTDFGSYFREQINILNIINEAIHSLDLSNIQVQVKITEELEAVFGDFDLNFQQLELKADNIHTILNIIHNRFEDFLYSFQQYTWDETSTNLQLRDFITNFLQNFKTFQADQLEMQAGLSQFTDWYQDYFFYGLTNWSTRHIKWMREHEKFLQSEAQYHTNQLEFLTGDYSLPTDSDVPYLVELEKALIEDEIEVPDDKIYEAQQEVKTDMEEVEHELTGAMDVVDSAFSGFLGDVKFNWGSFNPVMSFSYTLPFHDYTMQLTYDFSESDMRTPCRTASTGIWGIVLFVQSFLAISGALRGVIEN